MAQKPKQRPSPLDDPPSASSSSDSEEEDQQSSSQHHEAEDQEGEEEEVASSEEASSEEDDEEEDQPPTPPQPPTINPPPPPTNSHSHPKPSSSETETETESDSASDTEVKPLASKPMGQAQKPKAHHSPAPHPKSGSKRAIENNAHASDPKRAKKKVIHSSASAPPSDEDDVKKKSQRLWSDDDQLAILKGMAEFISNTGQDPYKHADAFHDFIKKSLHVEVSSNQLKEKIRRLKKKFEINADKMKNGEDLKFPKPHDQKAFELSEKVWGSEQVSNGAVEKAKPNGKITKTLKKESGGTNVASAKDLEPEHEVASVDLKECGKIGVDGSLVLSEMSRFQSLHGLNKEEVKKGLELMGESKRAGLEGKWKKLRAVETELFANRAILTGEQTRLILEVLQSSNH